MQSSFSFTRLRTAVCDFGTHLSNSGITIYYLLRPIRQKRINLSACIFSQRVY